VRVSFLVLAKVYSTNQSTGTSNRSGSMSKNLILDCAFWA
jgi:hypothetical protein